MKEKILRGLSYVLVAAVASVLTMLLSQGSVAGSKLNVLEGLILTRFIGQTDKTAMEDAAAEAMVNSLGDRWSHYMSAEAYKSYQEQMQNAYVGIGISITVLPDGQGFHIEEVTAGGPAQEAGLLVGDIITHIEGQSVENMTTAQARDLIRGVEETRVQLTLRRGGEQLQIAVERRSIQVPVATGELLGEVGYVRIVNFDARCSQETLAVIQDLQNRGATALLFDVRNNPGGYQRELCKVLDALLPEGPIFRSEDYTGKVEVDTSDADCISLPMAVLVNENSYSAAEFFAAALSEYKVATVVGQKTTGKGYFQNTYGFADGSAVALSIGKYTTPNGVSLADVGITPDVVVEVDDLTAAKIYYHQLPLEQDPQVQAALQALSGK